MRLTKIVLTNFLAHRRFVLPLAPLTLVCGPNGAGKSSLAEGVRFALFGEQGRAGSKAAERRALIADGAEEAQVELLLAESEPVPGVEPVSLVRDVRSAKMLRAGTVPLGAAACGAALPFVLAPERFARATPDERRALLAAVMGVGLTPADLKAALVERGHDPTKVSLLPLAKPPAQWPEVARTKASEARGAWKATTGEAYGAQKAATWNRATVPAPSKEEVEEAEQALHDAGRATAAARTALAEFDANWAAQMRRMSLLQRQRDAADQLAGIREALKAPAALIDMGERTLARLAQEEVALPSSADGVMATLCCPCCSTVVTFRGGRLIKGHVEPDLIERGRVEGERARIKAAREDAHRRQTEARERQASMQSEEAGLVRLLGEFAEQAKLSNPDAMVGSRGDVAAALAACEAAESAASATVARLSDERRAAEGDQDVTARAAAHHAEVQAWTALEEALAPNGVPGEVLGRALGPLNATLKRLALDVEWPTVLVGADMGVTADSRPYALLCESEQWRADVLLAVALAIFSKTRVVLIDRFDVLDLPSRSAALAWFYGLTQDGELNTCLVLGTLKAVPRVPPDVAAVFLGEAPAIAQVAA